MGLDMYLCRRDEAGDVEIGYWRKFNALHTYILTLTGSPMDSNCEEIDLDLDHVNTILRDLYAVQELLRTDPAYNCDVDDGSVTFSDDTIVKVERIMKPHAGFFWGELAIDHIFANQVTNAIAVFESAKIDLERGDTIYYNCWW